MELLRLKDLLQSEGSVERLSLILGGILFIIVKIWGPLLVKLAYFLCDFVFTFTYSLLYLFINILKQSFRRQFPAKNNFY
jgi:hypothetical protein